MGEIKEIKTAQAIIQNKESLHLLANPIFQKDTWHTIDDLGLSVNLHRRRLTLDFQGILQDWLRILVKIYILVRSQLNLSSEYLAHELSNLNKFSRFLEISSINGHEQINNQVFQDFDDYLHKLNLAKRTISKHYITLNSFFNVCRLEGWLDINTYWFEGRRLPYRFISNDEIDYIPEEVWNQLEQNLHHLPESIQRMVLIIRTTGMRVGELLNLPLDCLRKRGGQWRLRFTTEKYKIDDELPILPELVVIIKQQQTYIRKHLKDNYDKLFCSSRGNRHGFMPTSRVMNVSTFNCYLNKLASSCHICTHSGEIWHFKSHQFRKTIGTVLTNAGVRDLIIQKYLRHRSPDMQRHYTHLLKQVLESEYKDLMREKSYVDITGRVVANYKPRNPMTELMRRKMYQITTQYGECHRPTIKIPCQTVNACWQCEHWRTSTDDLPYLEEDIKQIQEELNITEKLGLVRQQQGLENDFQNLKVRIEGLRGIDEQN